MVEFNRRTITDRTSRRIIQERVKYFFRIPNKIGRGLGMRCANTNFAILRLFIFPFAG